jgi:hypothetical protein
MTDSRFPHYLGDDSLYGRWLNHFNLQDLYDIYSKEFPRRKLYTKRYYHWEEKKLQSLFRDFIKASKKELTKIYVAWLDEIDEY